MSLSDDVHINKVLQRYGLAPLIAGFSNKGGKPGADAGQKGPQIGGLHPGNWRQGKVFAHEYSSLMASANAMRLMGRLVMALTNLLPMPPTVKIVSMTIEPVMM